MQETKKPVFNPWVRKIPWRRAWQPTVVFCLENPVDRRACRATVHNVAKSQTRLKRLSMSSLKQPTLILTQFCRLQTPNCGVGRAMIPQEGLGKNFSLHLAASSGGWQSLVSLSLWQHEPNLCLYLHMANFSACVCVHIVLSLQRPLFRFLSFYKHTDYWIRTDPDAVWPHLNLKTSIRT